MDTELQTDRSLPVTRYRFRYNSIGIRVRAAAVIVLLFAVAGLSTLAKDGLYFPRTSIARHTSDSTKMMTRHASVVFICGEEAVVKTCPPPPVQDALPIQAATAPARQVGVVISMQHRSPPTLSTL